MGPKTRCSNALTMHQQSVISSTAQLDGTARQNMPVST
jgi:hypothetical protein